MAWYRVYLPQPLSYLRIKVLSLLYTGNPSVLLNTVLSGRTVYVSRPFRLALLFVAGMPMFERLALRWSRAAAAAGSTVSPSDGAALHANPNFVNAVLIALIACIFLSVMLDSSLRRLFVGMPTSGLRMNDVWLRCAR